MMEIRSESSQAWDYRLALQGYRAEIADLESRARAVRDAWFSADHETNQQQADELDREARDLRLSLGQLMRHLCGVADDRGVYEDDLDEECR